MIEELDLITLTTDLPEYGLKQEDRATVVHAFKDGAAYEVEFIKAGKTVAVATLESNQIRPYKANTTATSKIIKHTLFTPLSAEEELDG
jgi:hypothetical protein